MSTKKESAVDVGATSATTRQVVEGPPKVKAGTYTLAGHPTPFRRTVSLDGSSKSTKKRTANPETVQLVFQPGVDYSLSEIEAEGCADLIERGFLIESNRDAKGRQRTPSTPRTDADSVIDRLEKKVEELAAENAELKAKLENAPKVTMPVQVQPAK